jgi:outer membrane protein TolC
MEIGTLLLALAGGVAAETGTTLTASPDGTSLTGQTLEFEPALVLARQSNKNYLMELERKRAADAKWWQAALMFGPTASLQGGYILENKPMTMSIDFGSALGMPGSTPEEIPLSTNYYSGQVSVAQPLFAGFKLTNSFRLAGLQSENALATVALAYGQLYQDVTQAFYGLMMSQKLLSVMEQSLAQMQEHLNEVKIRYREGSASNYDLLRSEVQVANQQPAVLKMRNAVVLARRNLVITLGMNPETLISIQGDLKTKAEKWPALDDLQKQARARRLELKNMERAGRMAEIGQFMATWNNLPNVALTGNWTYYDTLDETYPPEGKNLKHSWQIGVGVSWTFWDNLMAWPKAEEAGAKVREAEWGRQAMVNGIRLEVEAAYLALMTSQEMVKAQQKNAELAEQGYRIAEQRYANGMMTNIEVMDAQLAWNQAQSNYLQAQYDEVVARVKLHRAVGDTF